MILLLIVINVLDINTAPLSELKSLPLSGEKVQEVYYLRQARGYLRSVYELREVLSAEDFNKIKGLIRVTPPEEEDWTAAYIEQLQERLASEEGPTQSAIDHWQTILLEPIDINECYLT